MTFELLPRLRGWQDVHEEITATTALPYTGDEGKDYYQLIEGVKKWQGWWLAYGISVNNNGVKIKMRRDLEDFTAKISDLNTVLGTYGPLNSLCVNISIAQYDTVNNIYTALFVPVGGFPVRERFSLGVVATAASSNLLYFHSHAFHIYDPEEFDRSYRELTGVTETNSKLDALLTALQKH